MTLPPFQPGRLRVRPFREHASPTQWLALLGLSAPLIFLFEAMHLPAALLLGPMIAGIVVSMANATLRVPPYAFTVAQGVVGCMIAHAIPLAIAGEILRNWPLFLMGVVSVIAAAAAARPAATPAGKSSPEPRRSGARRRARPRPWC